MSSSDRLRYQVTLRSSRVERELIAVPRADSQRISEAIKELSERPRPRGSTRIRGDIYRIRVGRFRILYSINDAERTVTIGSVRRRSEDTYQNVRRLF